MKKRAPISMIAGTILLFSLLATGAWSADSTSTITRVDSSRVKRVKNFRYMGWFIRLIASSGDVRDTNTIIGYRRGSRDGKDVSDSVAMGSYGLYSAIERDDGREYRSDYRRLKPVGRVTEEWDIVVHDQDRGADVTLSWRGVTIFGKNRRGHRVYRHRRRHKILSMMRLVDMDSGEIVKFSERRSYSFNMDGAKERHLRVILLKNGAPEPEIENLAREESKNMMRSISRHTAESAEEKVPLKTPWE